MRMTSYVKNSVRSSSLYKEALKHIPGGVNSPVRAFKAVGGHPVFFERAKGAHLFDIDGRKYIDYILSWGPLILGHSHPNVVKAISDQIKKGISFGSPTEAETELAKLITGSISSIEKVRLVNSGTEACMSAIRLARAYTKRNLIIKFEGCYHGHSDSMLVKAGSGLLTFGVPSSDGITASLARSTVVLPYNDTDAISASVKKNLRRIAAIIVEPVAGNMGVILPQEGFLVTLRKLCDKYNIVLIFDEVITGYRFYFGAYQDLIGIKADLTTLGKIIGGGLPIGAFGGRREIMDLVSPLGNVYQAGTLSGNSVAVSAGLATLKTLKKNRGLYRRIDLYTQELENRFNEIIRKKGIDLTFNRLGSMFTIFFAKGPVVDFQSAKRSDTQKYSAFFHKMLEAGIYLAPSQFEACFVGVKHTEAELEKTIKYAYSSL